MGWIGKYKKRLIISFSIVGFLLIGGYLSMDLVTSYVLKAIAGGSGSTGSAVETGADKLDELAKSGNGDLMNSDTSDAEDLSYREEVSTEKAKAVDDAMTLREKLKVASTLLKRLGPSELEMFFQLASGGLSLDEKREAKRAVLKKLSEKEYNELIAIAQKYGLSNGKNYQDSLVEQGMATPKPTTTPVKQVTTSDSGKKNDAVYNKFVAQAKAKLVGLQGQCQSKLTAISSAFMESGDAALIDQGQAALSSCDGQFESIVAGLEKDLKAKGYATGVVQEMRGTYESTKANALASLLNKMSP